MKRTSTLFLTRGALIAALYVALTFAAAAFGLASGTIQFRIYEMLCILPIFMPEAVLALTVGCLVSNVLFSGVVWDIIFGSFATLIGAYLTRLLRHLPERWKFIATLPTVLSNAVIIPFVLIYAFGSQSAYFFLFLSVLIGEFLAATLLGTLLYYALKRTALFK